MNNPFAVPPAPVNTAAAPPAAVNPFDPLAPPPADPFANAPPLQPTPTGGSGGEQPFASPASTAVPPYGSPQVPFAASSPPAPQQQAPPPQVPQQQAPPHPLQQSQQGSSYETALVPSQYQSNPYGGLASMGSMPTTAPVSADNFQWGLDASAAPHSGAGSFYGNYPPPAQQAPPPAYGYTPVPQTSSNMSYQEPQQQSGYVEQQQPPTTTGHREETTLTTYQPKPVDEPIDSKELRPAAYEYGQRDLPTEDRRREDEFKNYVNPYRNDLAREAPPGASPLPKPDLVRKKGYVLSRISFRTIVMKKWKQTFWVQYGPHTMLWFRNESDFSDWLNNPYHDQATRNFLIKLAVNFVHDLYKPNVRGYQVTQCRTKAYGNKMVRQFKLERWMDYGPTIAAAFGSYDPQEVDELRAAIVECMRNTPLNSGIRATGAVRRERQEDDGSHDRYDDQRSHDSERRGDRSQASQNNFNSAPSAEESVAAAEEDLLDVNNWNDVPSQTPVNASLPPGQIPPHNPYGQQPLANPYDQHPQPNLYAGAAPAYPYPAPPQQTTTYVAAPQQIPVGQNAMVPFAGASTGYPGAPAQPYATEPWAAQPQQQFASQQPVYTGSTPPQQYHTQAY